MTETSSNKTKRKQIELLGFYNWVTQISYFYTSYEDSRNIIEDGKKLRKRIRRLNPDVAFLCKLRFITRPSSSIDDAPRDQSRVVMPYWTVYSTRPFKTKEAETFLPKDIAEGIHTKKRAVQAYHLDSAIRAINGQKLYQVEKHLGAKANSYYIINKSMLSHYLLDQESTTEEQASSAPKDFF